MEFPRASHSRQLGSTPAHPAVPSLIEEGVNEAQGRPEESRMTFGHIGEELKIHAPFAVRGAPVINDATLTDARTAGITDLVTVVDNGSDAPGTLLSECSEAFRRRFGKADLIIAKGQGNYEALSETGKDIFFLLKAKCPVIADHLACPVGSLVVHRSACAAASASRRENGMGAPR